MGACEHAPASFVNGVYRRSLLRNKSLQDDISSVLLRRIMYVRSFMGS